MVDFDRSSLGWRLQWEGNHLGFDLEEGIGSLVDRSRAVVVGCMPF